MDVENAKKVAEFIKKNPERLNQDWWTNIACGYASTNPINDGFNGCAAGITAFLLAPEGTKFYNSHLWLPDGKDTQYSIFAAYALSLTPCEQETLFYNTDGPEEALKFLEGSKEYQHAVMTHTLKCQGRSAG